jgi:CheY-like chemotaxis protein
MGARILVADDSVTIQKVVELTFSKEDFTLVQARNGEEAIRKAKEARPDIILLDLVMPDKNGYEVCAAIRAEPSLRSTPIILLAGTFEAFDPSRGAEAGANDFITKPFESQTLIGKVKQLLFTKSVTAAPAPPPRPGAEVLRPAIGPPRPAGPLLKPFEELQPPKATAAAAPEPAPAFPDDPWQLLAGAPSSPPAPVEEPVVSPPAHTMPEPPTDFGLLELTPAAPTEIGAPERRPASIEEINLPDALSLDDLLVGEPDAPAQLPPPPPDPAPRVVGPVFELPADDVPLLPMVEAGKGEPPKVKLDELAPPAPPQEGVASMPMSDLADMRQEVAARVAHDLTRELSQKLVERFEKIVWEVVPDLAEILITREIERIRRVAEGDKSL